MYWEKSFIPKPNWQVGDTAGNVIGGVHADAHHEGISCTLVGGAKNRSSFR
jgi:hypothetical protein